MMDIKKFFERDSCRGPISSAELLAFKHSCTEDEYNGYVADAKAENAKATATVAS